MPNLEGKVVVLGSQGVGKTSVVVRYTRNSFNKMLSPTIGASFFTCALHIDNRTIKLQVWDTAGQERFRAMAPMYYRKANAALLVYDISSHESFQDMMSWVKELQKNTDGKIVYCLVGNKCDLADRRKVTTLEAESFAASIGAKNFEVSALADKGLNAVFHHIAESLVKILTEELAEFRSDHFSSRSCQGSSDSSENVNATKGSATAPSISAQRTLKKTCC